MRVGRVRAMARKEFLHVVRDPRSLGMGIAIPMLLLVLFGYALSLDVDNVPLVVWDQSGTPASREFLCRFADSRYFAVRGHVSTYRDIERAIDANRALAGLVVPEGLGSATAAGRRQAVQLIVDGSDANTALIALGYAETVVQLFNRDMAAQGVPGAARMPPAGPVELRPRVWYNEDLESRNVIVPGLISIIMMVIAALLTSLTVAREWENGTMEQLISTPVRGSELILGKLLPYFAIGMVDVALTVLTGNLLFHVPLRGSVWLLFGMASVYLAGVLSLGMLISIATRSQLLASQIALVATFLPAFLLSGFMFAIGNMPKAVQVVSCIVPARYFVTLLQGVFLKGVGLDVLGLDAAVLVAFSVVVALAANAKLRKKVAA